MGQNIVQKIISSHLVSGRMNAGEEIATKNRNDSILLFLIMYLWYQISTILHSITELYLYRNSMP